jgi:hypothetical protein
MYDACIEEISTRYISAAAKLQFRGALEDYIEQMIAMSFEENNKKNAFL